MEIYDRGAIAMGNGELLTVTNVKVTTTDNSKQIHTLRRKGAGVTQGTEETTVTFDAVVGDQGEEADWLNLVKKKILKTLRIKIPGRTMTVKGKYKDVDYELPLDDAVKVSLGFIGKMDD